MEMMAMRLHGPNDMRYEKVPVPELGPADVRVKVAFCGICGTDEEFYFGTSSFWAAGLIHTPMTMGHECSGVVDAVGSEVTRVKVGDTVVIDPIISCGRCDACILGRRQECADLRCVGTINSVDGGYAEYAVFPEKGVWRLPDTIELQSAALIEPLSISLYAVERAGIQIGDTVLVAGTGAIGLGAIPFIRMKGAGSIIVAGRRDCKLATAKAMGADITVNINAVSLREAVADATGGKMANCIIDTAGSAEFLLTLLDLAAYDARVSIPSFYGNTIEHFPIDQNVLKNISMSFVFSNADTYPRVIRTLASDTIDLSPMITRTYPLKDAVCALQDLKSNKETRIKYMLDMSL